MVGIALLGIIAGAVSGRHAAAVKPVEEMSRKELEDLIELLHARQKKEGLTWEDQDMLKRARSQFPS